MSIRSFIGPFYVLGVTLLISGCSGGGVGTPHGGVASGNGGASSAGGVVPGSIDARRSATKTTAVRVYVVNSGTNRVTVYSASASCGTNGLNGNVKPVATIAGSSTGLNDPQYIALDATKKVYVTNYNNSSVTVYAAGASGDVSWVALIGCSNTGLNLPYGVAVDAANKIYVANQGPSGAYGSVTVYAAGASGNVKPIATISGSNTGIDTPQGIALDKNKKIYVTNVESNSVTVYAAGANGDVTPTATISGSNTGLYLPYGIALDSKGNIYVSNGPKPV